MIPCVLLLFCVSAQSAVAAEPGATELEGSWRVIGVVFEGRTLGEEAIGNATFEFQGDRLESHLGDQGRQFRIELRTGTTPKQIDLVPVSEEGVGMRRPGIFKIEQGVLTFCSANAGVAVERPVTFDAPAGSGYVLMYMKRIEGDSGR